MTDALHADEVMKAMETEAAAAPLHRGDGRMTATDGRARDRKQGGGPPGGGPGDGNDDENEEERNDYAPAVHEQAPPEHTPSTRREKKENDNIDISSFPKSAEDSEAWMNSVTHAVTACSCSPNRAFRWILRTEKEDTTFE